MAQCRQEFLLVGYSECLERRPLKFVDPIPATLICSACGNVPRLTFSLLCGHVLCEPCCRSCATTSKCICPLDGDDSAIEDVSSKKYPVENMLRRKVHCWNEVNGCRVVLPASQVAEHVRNDCQNHVTCCPKCKAAVLSLNMCAHLKSRCTALVMHAAPEAELGTDNHEKSFEKQVGQRVLELDAKLSQLSLESASQKDKLDELCHNIVGLTQTLKQQFGTASVQTSYLLDRNATEMKSLYCEKTECLMSAITSALPPVRRNRKTHQRTISGYAALKEEAVRDSWSESMSDKVYLRRYLLSWSIQFEQEDDSVCLYLWIQLHEGKDDDFLDWPFTKELKLSVIHPATREERLLCVTPDVSGENREHFRRPIGGSNEGLCFGVTWLDSIDIERDGYVENDQLLVRLEVAL